MSVNLTCNFATMLNWDDYRYVLAIAQAGNLVGASKALNVTLTTVMRRLEKIEDRTDAPLFTKTREGYLPTKTGLHIVRAAERIADSVSEAEHGLRKIDNSLTGVIRLSASEVAAPFFLARHVPDALLRLPCGRPRDAGQDRRGETLRRHCLQCVRIRHHIRVRLELRRFEINEFPCYVFANSNAQRGNHRLAGIDRHVTAS